MKTEQWIYWRWKDGSKSFLKSWIQDVVTTDKGLLLELSDSESWTNYPNKVLLSEIDYTLLVK